MDIRILAAGTELRGTLDDTSAGRDFAALLPLTLTLRDFASAEKISDLPRRLDTSGAPAGTAGRAGDLASRPVGQPGHLLPRLDLRHWPGTPRQPRTRRSDHAGRPGPSLHRHHRGDHRLTPAPTDPCPPTGPTPGGDP